MSQLTALFATLTIEAPIMLLLLRKQALATTYYRLLIITVVPTLITHPILWFVLANLPKGMPYYTTVMALEIVVVFAEAFLLYSLTTCRIAWCFLISSIANGASLVAGVLAWRFLP